MNERMDTEKRAPVTVPQLLAGASERAAALIEPGGEMLTYGALRATVDDLAGALRALGVGAGERVAIALPGGIPIICALLGIARARAVAAPLNPSYTYDEYRFYLNDIAPALVLVGAGSDAVIRDVAATLALPVREIAIGGDGRVSILDAAVIAPPEDPRADDVVLLLHTSGTTSGPKGVPLRHKNVCASVENITRWYQLGTNDVSLCVMPLFHVHGIIFSTLAFLAAGASVVVPPRFSAGSFWYDVARYDVTVVSAMPTIYRTLLARADADGAPRSGEHSLRFIRSSSAALPATVFHALEARFGVPVIEAYSMTEAAHQMCANPLTADRRAGSVGIGAFVDVSVLDDAGTVLPHGTIGEVAVRGRNVIRAYHKNPEADATAFINGWFRTGDRGFMNEDGFLTLVGRIKELINRGGEKIAPAEIDECLLRHAAVIEAVTFGIADEKYGEAVAVAVVVHDGTSVDDVLAHARAHLAPFKIPTRVFVTDAIPKTATGKVQRRARAAKRRRALPRCAIPSHARSA